MIIQPWRSPAWRFAPAGRPGPGGAGTGAADLHPAGSATDGPATVGATETAGRPRLALPPGPMPRRQGTRPLKCWRYVGIFGPDVMLCAGAARVGPLPQAFWAIWDRRAGVLDTETRVVAAGGIRVGATSVEVRSGPARVELALSPAGEPVEVVSPHGGSYIWTRKTPVRAHGHITLGMEARPFSGTGLMDESAGYHARRTEWEWSAGVGTTVDGWPAVWNLVRGVHDSPTMSERTVWVNGRAVEPPPVRFSEDLDELWGSDGSVLRFDAEATRSRRENFGLLRSEYVQPFGRFRGMLPGGFDLSDQEPAFGVMERHRALW